MNVGNFPNYSENPFNQQPDDKIKKEVNPSESSEPVPNSADNGKNEKEVKNPSEESATQKLVKGTDNDEATGQGQHISQKATNDLGGRAIQNGALILEPRNTKSSDADKLRAQILALKAKMKAQEEEEAKLQKSEDSISNKVDAKNTEISDEKQIQSAEKQTQSTEKQVEIKETNVVAIAAQAVNIKSTKDVLLSADTHNLLKDLHAWSLDKNGHLVQIHRNTIDPHDDKLFFTHIDKAKGGVRPILNRSNPHHKAILDDPKKFTKLKEHLAKHHGVPVLDPILLDNKHFTAFLQLMNLVYSKKVQIHEDDKKDKAPTTDGDEKVDKSQDLSDVKPDYAKKYLEEMNYWLTKLSFILRADERRQEFEKAIIKAKNKLEREFILEVMEKELDRLEGIQKGHIQEQKEPIILNINPEDFLREKGFKF